MEPNDLVFPAKDRAELIADSLEHQFQTNPGPDIPEVTAYYQSLQNLNTTNYKLFTTPGTIQKIISNLCKKKAPGDDLITNTALKFLPNNTLLSLTQIINSSFRICYFPLAWKKAVIISIPKPGKDHKLPENYRPIALLSSISKIYERLILNHLQNILSPEQFAFRPEHSTMQQLTKLTHQLSQNFNNNINTASIYLDVEKAFDRVWHAGLLFKLSQLNIPTDIVKIIESFLTDRTFITKIEDSFSSTRHILAGVPQEFCLSPTLYLTYINDIPTTPKSHISLFVDDTMFFTYDHNQRRAAIQLQHQELDSLIINWNANGIKKNRNTFAAFLSAHNVYIACVSETHLIASDKIKFDGYTTYRKDRIAVRPSGGVAIIIKSKIKHRLTYLPATQTLEAVAISITINQSITTIISAYQSSSFQMYINDFEKILNSYQKIILVGDLNCKHTTWYCKSTNANGRKLYKYLASNPAILSAPDTPTYNPYDQSRSPDILDVIILKSIRFSMHQEPLFELDSDHLPVKITLDASLSFSTPTRKLITGNADWQKFKQHITTNLIIPKNILNINSADTAVTHLREIICQAAEEWKLATIIMIKKPGKDNTDPRNYRPICLLSSVSKIFEKIIHSRLTNYLNAINAIPHFQFGFKSNHSTTQQLLRLTEHISNGYEKKQHTGAAFLNVAQALDRVWYDGLLYKLKILNTPNAIFNLIKSYLTARRFKVKINDTPSQIKIINAGVLQGSKISPLLFNIYVSDFSTSINTEIALYADDSAIYSSSTDVETVTKNMQDHLNGIQIWGDKWKIKLNPQKSTAVLFTNRRPKTPGNLKLYGNNIPWSPSIKYLGVILDRKLTWNPQITSKLQQGYQRLKILYPLLNRQSSLSWKCFILLYKQILQPLLLYAVPVWGNCAKTHIHKIQIFQSKVLRTKSNAPWFIRNAALHTDFQLPSITDYIKKLTINFFNHLESASSAKYYNLSVPPSIRRLKRGRQHDLLR
ncbi:hypothetical protein QTP88_020260 [Uroleucon formosanum]